MAVFALDFRGLSLRSVLDSIGLLAGCMHLFDPIAGGLMPG